MAVVAKQDNWERVAGEPEAQSDSNLKAQTIALSQALDTPSPGDVRKDNEPIFICGALRSGTTLFRLMLDQHPEMSNPGEFDFLFECRRGESGHYDLEKYLNNLSTDRIFLASGLKIRNQESYPALVRDFVDQLASRQKILTINIHRNFEIAAELFPDARFIHLLRDPRDVARSTVNMGWAGNAYYGVRDWVESEISFKQLREQVPTQNIFELRYEALVLFPQLQLQQCCNFLGITFHDAMLEYDKNSTYSKPDEQLVEQWRRKMTQRELGLIDGYLGPMLQECQYQPTHAPIIEPTQKDAILLAIDNKFKRLKKKVSLYGLPVTVAMIVANRLPEIGLKRWVQRWHNRVETQLLK